MYEAIVLINWREKIDRKRTQVVPLRQILRLKTNLAVFVKIFARHIGLEYWEVEPYEEVHGGRVIIIEGAYAKDRRIHDEILDTNKSDGNKPVDMLFCVPPDFVPEKSEKRRYSIVGEKFQEWGFKIWDGVAPDIREYYPTDPEQLRIVQYDSCRGLEGWIVVNFEFDKFYDYKIATFETSADEEADTFFDKEQAVGEYVAQWLMIPLTRAMDTLVIQVTSKDHFVTKALRRTANLCQDFVEWRVTK